MTMQTYKLDCPACGARWEFEGVDLFKPDKLKCPTCKRIELPPSSQKAAIAVDILPALEAEARERQGKRNDLTSVKKLTEVERATAHAAHIVGTNRQYVSDAKRIKQADPQLFEQIRNGELSITQAKRKRLRKSARQKSLVKEHNDEQHVARKRVA